MIRAAAVLGAMSVYIGGEPALAGKSEDTMVVAFQRGISTLDHLYSTIRETIILSRLTDDGLTMVDPETLEPVPTAAKSFKFVGDTTIDFEIRDGVRFHDGSLLTADDVAYTYDWVLDKKSRTKRGRLIRGWLESVEKTGPMSVRFHMKYPYPLALRDIAHSVQLRKRGTYHRDDGGTRRRAQARILNGIGPYKVVSYERGKMVTVERFAEYYRDSPKGRPAIERIVFRTFPDWIAQQTELISGNVDWMYNVPTDIARAMGTAGRAQHIEGPSLRIGFIPMDAANLTDIRKNPFTRVEVRRAVIHAIDREAIVRNLVKGGAKVIHSACHPIQFGCAQDVATYAYDPDKARDLLAAAGYPNGFEFDFWVYREKPVAKAIIADLAKVKIRARMRYVGAARILRGRRLREVAAFFATWGSGGAADVAAIARRHWSLSSDRNMSGDKEVEGYMLGAQRIRDPEMRKQLYRKGLRLIAERAYWAPLYSFSLNYLVSNDLYFPVPKDGMPRLYRAKWK